MQDGGFQNHPLMKLTLGLTLFLLLGFWVTNFLLYFSKMGLTPSSVIDYYRGSEEAFTAARSFRSMVEVAHFHLPMMAVVMLILTHLVIFIPFPNKAKVGIIVFSFSVAFLNESACWLVRFVSPNWAILKPITFLSLQSILGFLMGSLGWFLWISPGKKISKNK
jgi:hypothetical protein